MPKGANMKMIWVLLLGIICLLLIVPFSIPSQTVNDMTKEMSAIGGDIDRIDRMISENKATSRLLQDQEKRLRAVLEDPQLYRLPVLIEGKALYVTLNDSDLDDFSNSLVLDDLLTKYKVTKGRFRSDDPKEWKQILIREGLQAKDHLRDVEIPAIQKRIGEIDRETASLEVKRVKLSERYRALQQRVTK
jgi:hypothetical protein